MNGMNEVIRARRRALGMTQEEVARRLGVSAPAVSKWEQGASFPDVTLLPALARLLRTDLNTLMGFERSPDRQTLSRMLEQVRDTARTQGQTAALALARTLAQTYPDSGELLYALAAVLEGRAMMSGEPTDEAVRAQAETWYRRAADGEDGEAREAAAYLLAGRLLARGEIDAAQEMLSRLPQEPAVARWPLEAGLLQARGEQEQARAYLERTLYLRAGDVQQILLRLVQAALDAGDAQRAQMLAERTQQFVRLMGMHPYVGHLAMLLPALARQDRKESIAHIRGMLEALERPWSPGADTPIADVKAVSNPDMLGGILREMEESDDYAFLRGEAEFTALLAAHRKRA